MRYIFILPTATSPFSQFGPNTLGITNCTIKDDIIMKIIKNTALMSSSINETFFWRLPIQNDMKPFINETWWNDIERRPETTLKIRKDQPSQGDQLVYYSKNYRTVVF